MTDDAQLLRGPFRGSRAVQQGLVTENALRGPHYRRLFPDVYLHTSLAPDLGNRSRGAALLAADRGVLSGYSATALLGAKCAPHDANAELTLCGSGLRERPGLTLHRETLEPDEVTTVDGLAVTTPLRTAWDLARWLPTVEAVVSVDALAATRFNPEVLHRIQERYPRARWRRRVPGVIDLADPRAESAMETRSRLVLVQRGLPRPVLQHKVYDARGRFVARLDMAYPDVRLGVEYDGRGHLPALEQAKDARRQNALDACGWYVFRLTAGDIYTWPDETAERVRAAIERRLRARAS